MKNIVCISLIILFSFTQFSCKEDKKIPVKDTVAEQQAEDARKIETERRQEEVKKQKEQTNSVFAKLMLTPEAKTFTSSVITVSLSDLLLKEEGPFTIFAPSAEAFAQLDEDSKTILNDVTLKASLERIIKTHIVAGRIDSIALTQNIRSGNGSYNIATMSGDTLIATKKGMDIVLKDKNGVKAVLVKSDIIGSNGVVHVLDNVLGLEK